MNKHTQELAKLITEHPDLDVVFMVSSSSDFSDHDYAPQKIERVYVGFMAEYKSTFDQHCYFGENMEEVVKNIRKDLFEPDDESELVGFEFKEVIIVETGAL